VSALPRGRDPRLRAGRPEHLQLPLDPAGAVVKYYADLYQVWDERTYVPGKWAIDDHRGQNLWGPSTPRELIEAYTPLA
jgi:hypothetical protein